jgi:hypothetical protein
MKKQKAFPKNYITEYKAEESLFMTCYTRKSNFLISVCSVDDLVFSQFGARLTFSTIKVCDEISVSQDIKNVFRDGEFPLECVID